MDKILGINKSRGRFMQIPLSVVILAKNEEARIEDCLKSVFNWAGEIIILDDNSTDRTSEIASKFNVRIIKRTMELEGKQRNFGACQAKFDWVIMVDCDERLTSELKQEISELITKKNDDIMAYWIPKINYLGNHLLKYGGWSNPHVKLYNRNHVRWSEAKYDVVHPGIIVDQGYRGGHLKNPYIHYNFESIEDFIKKDNRYSTLEAIKWHVSGRKMTLGRAIWRTGDRFLRRFIMRKGRKDGFYGFMAACIGGFHELLTYAKYRELKESNLYIDKYIK